MKKSTVKQIRRTKKRNELMRKKGRLKNSKKKSFYTHEGYRDKKMINSTKEQNKINILTILNELAKTVKISTVKLINRNPTLGFIVLVILIIGVTYMYVSILDMLKSIDIKVPVCLFLWSIIKEF